MIRSFTLGLLFAAGLCLAVPAMSQETKKATTTLDVAFYEAGYLYSGGKGIDKDVVEEIARRAGYSFKYVEQPRIRIWATLEDGTLPMSVSGLQTPARDKFAYFIPYIVQKNKALVLGDKKINAEAFAADKSSKIAVVRGFKHGDFFDRIVERVRTNGGVFEVPTIHNLFLMLQSGERVSMIISQPALYAKELKDLGMESKVSIQDLDADGKGFNLGLILSKAHFSAADVAKMQGVVNDMKKDGTLAAIFAKYLNKQDATEALKF